MLSLPAFPRVRALPQLTSHNLKEKTATRDPGQERKESAPHSPLHGQGP